ncbi:MAG: hypothetical protein JHC81_04745 [Brevundimonas sp.]|uniref:hypothetical protein n=1 Tax=Brevundimonas sp. TaxID=1871086 RepID=UPI001A28C37E|nr:hypothetical protein [Brevundimonas sp.]MBJ7446822.1 hypothetical protein [Brevundimonas sp.]
MSRDPLRFTAPHRLGCDCHGCQRARHAAPTSGIQPPRTPEDGQHVATPESALPITTREG